jgi:hypothetical protein
MTRAIFFCCGWLMIGGAASWAQDALPASPPPESLLPASLPPAAPSPVTAPVDEMPAAAKDGPPPRTSLPPVSGPGALDDMPAAATFDAPPRAALSLPAPVTGPGKTSASPLARVAAAQEGPEHALHDAHHGEHELSAEDVPDHEAHPASRFLFRGEYVLWIMKKETAPPLVSTGLNTDPQPGVLIPGQSTVLYGPTIDPHERHGARFTLGYFLDDAEMTSLEASYAFAGNKDALFSVRSLGTSLGLPLIARPFFNAVSGKEDASLVAFPGVSQGVLDINFRSFFDTGELNFACTICGEKNKRIDLLAGFRSARLDEDLVINELDIVNGAAKSKFANQAIAVQDRFRTENRFWGGQVGARALGQWKRLSFETTAKVALGLVNSEIDIGGSTFANGNPNFVQQAGLLALASNSGRFRSNDFAVVPEIHAQLGYRFTERFQVYVGYSFLYMSDVFRPGEQIDRRLNPNLIPTSTSFGVPGGPQAPAPQEASTDFWIHGLRVGFEIKF